MVHSLEVGSQHDSFAVQLPGGAMSSSFPKSLNTAIAANAAAPAVARVLVLAISVSICAHVESTCTTFFSLFT